MNNLDDKEKENDKSIVLRRRYKREVYDDEKEGELENEIKVYDDEKEGELENEIKESTEPIRNLEQNKKYKKAMIAIGTILMFLLVGILLLNYTLYTLYAIGALSAISVTAYTIFSIVKYKTLNRQGKLKEYIEEIKKHIGQNPERNDEQRKKLENLKDQKIYRAISLAKKDKKLGKIEDYTPFIQELQKTFNDIIDKEIEDQFDKETQSLTPTEMLKKLSGQFDNAIDKKLNSMPICKIKPQTEIGIIFDFETEETIKAEKIVFDKGMTDKKINKEDNSADQRISDDKNENTRNR